MASWPRKFAHVVLLVSTALLAACGGGGGGGGGGSGGGSGGGNPAGAFSVSSSSVTLNATQGGATPPPQVVELSTNSGVFVGTGAVAISTSQSGGRFFHSFAITGNTTGQITITPGVTFDAGSFVGTITVNGCSNS